MTEREGIFSKILGQPDEVEAHHDEEGYPRPRVPLAANWQQPKRPYNVQHDYMRLPRHRPDYGRAPQQVAKRRR